MKKVLALALVLCLAFALCLTPSAALPEGWQILEGSTLEFGTNVIINEDGYLEYTDAEATQWQGLAYDSTTLGNKYSVECEIYIPASEGGPEGMITLGSKTAYRPDGNLFWLQLQTWSGNVGQVYLNSHKGHVAASEAVIPEVVEGGWNKVVLMVEDGYVDYFFNGQLKLAAIDSSAYADNAGKYIVLGVIFDMYGPGASFAGNVIYRNVKITNANGQTTTYFDAPVADTADIEVVAIAGAMIAMLAAAAFVIKARKA